MRLIWISLGVAISATMAHAQDAEVSPFSPETAGTATFKRCNQNVRYEVERYKCLSDEFIRQEATLQGVLEASSTSETPNLKTKALVAQQAWLRYRDDRCNLWLQTNGSGAGNARLRCLVRETITRRSDLEHAWDD